MKNTGQQSERRIGQLAADLSVSPKTIRYYGQLGLLPVPRRTAAGYRVYGTAERDRLRFILKAKAVGLTLEEIATVLGARGGEQTCARVLELLDRKLGAVDEQLEALSQYREELLELRRDAHRTSRAVACVCGIIEHHEPAHPGAAQKATAALTYHRPARHRS